MRKVVLAATATAMLVASAAAPVAAQSDAEALLGELPEDLQALYVGYPGEITASELAGFAAGEAPWKMCHSESFQGNPWRVALSNELQRMADEFIAAGNLSEWKQSRRQRRRAAADRTDPGLHR